MLLKALTLFLLLYISLVLNSAKGDIVKDEFSIFDSKVWTADPIGEIAVEEGLLSLNTTGSIRVTSINSFRYAILETKIKLTTSPQPKKYHYIGFLSREPWAETACFIMTDGNNSFSLKTRKKGGDWNEGIASTGELVKDKWYAVKIIWSDSRIELFLDGKSVGFTEDPKKIPDDFMPTIIDVFSGGAGEVGIDVDWVGIQNGKNKKEKQSKISREVRFPPKIPIHNSNDLPFIRADIKVENDNITLENRYYLYQISLQKGISIKKIFNKYIDKDCLNSQNGSRIFSINIDGNQIDSTDFDVVNVKTLEEKEGKILNLSLSNKEHSIFAELNVRIDNTAESIWALNVTNNDSKRIKAKVTFPVIENARIGKDIVDNYYFYPFQAGWVDNTPYDIRVEYGLHAWMQLLDVFNINEGGGIYTYVKDDTGQVKTLILRKIKSDGEVPIQYWPIYLVKNNPEKIFSQNAGVTMAIQQLEEEIMPNSTVKFYPAVIGIHGDDWHTALESYSRWVHTWYKHEDIPEWWKDCFNYLSVHDYQGNYGYEKGFYSKKEERYIASESPAYPGDAQEWAFWWDYPEDVDIPWSHLIRKFWYGDYYYPQRRGGLVPFGEEIRKMQSKGVRINLYMEATLCWQDTDIGKKHGKKWARMDAPGVYNRDYMTSSDDGWVICLYEEGWQDHIAKRFGEIIKEIGVDGVRLDRTAVLFPCFNKEHEHYDGTFKSSISVSSFVNLYKKVRAYLKKANPEAVLLGEHAGSDYLSQFFDGSTVQQYNTALEIKHPHFVETYNILFFRFYFPEFKLWNWSYYYDTKTWEKLNRFTFFNGIGTNSTDLQSKDELDYLIKTGNLLRENSDAFSSLNPIPLVDTITPYVYANKFPAGDKILYTVYNRNNKHINGEIIEIPHREGYHHVELLYDNEVFSTVKNGKTFLSLDIAPEDVIAVAQLPQLLEVSKQNGYLSIRVKKEIDSPVLKVFINDDSEKGKSILLKDGEGKIDIKGYENGSKVIIKLFNGEYLVDTIITQI